MAKILGLDLGTNSIGWAIIESGGMEIIDAGVKIFPNHSETIKKISEKKLKKRKRVQTKFLKICTFLKPPGLTTIMLSIFTLTSGIMTLLNSINWQFWLNISIANLLALITINR